LSGTPLARPRRQLVHLHVDQSVTHLDLGVVAHVLAHVAHEGYRGCVIWDAHRVSSRTIDELASIARAHELHFTVGIPWQAFPSARAIAPAVDALIFEIDEHTQRPTHLSVAGLGLGRRLDVGITIATDDPTSVEHAARFAATVDARWLWLRAPRHIGESNATAQMQLAMAYAAARRMRSTFAGRLQIDFDMGERAQLLSETAEIVAAARARAELPLACLLSTLEITADGRVLPMHADFPERLALGSLGEAPLPDLIRRWRRWRWREFVDCCAAARSLIVEEEGWQVFDWSRVLLRAAASDATSSPS
jgi:hypothetical protein